MKTYEIQAPDGKTYSIQGPEGATREQVIAKIKERQQMQQPQQSAGFMGAVKDSPLGGVIRGLRDIPDAGAQLLTRGLEAVAPAGSGLEDFARSERQRVEGINQQAEQDYQQNWRRGQMDGIDTGRIAGNIAGTLPIARAVPVAAAATRGGQMAYGAGVGAASGAAMPVYNTQDFASEKGNQLVLGAAFGSVSPFIASAIGKAVQGVKNRFSATPSAVKPEVIKKEVAQALSTQGIKFDKLKKDVQKSILADVQASLKPGGDLDPELLARSAQFKQAGIQPTKGQLLRERDPNQYSFEQNTKNIESIGEPLYTRFTEQNKQLIRGVDRNRPGARMGAYEAGSGLNQTLLGVDAARREAVRAGYEKALATEGAQTPIDAKNLAKNIRDTLQESLSEDMLDSGVVRNILKRVTSKDRPLSIKGAEALRQSINGNITGIPSRENTVLKQINHLIQNEIDNVSSQLGGESGEAFKQARALAAKRFRDTENSTVMQAALGGKPVDDFIEKEVIRKPVKSVAALKNDLSRNPGAWEDVRGQVIDFLKRKATNNNPDGIANFSPSAYNKALNETLGLTKLKVLFSKEEIAELQNLSKVAQYMKVAPGEATINRSGTSQALANLARRVGKLPWLQDFLISPVSNYQKGKAVASAVNPQAAGVNAPPANLSPELVRLLNLPLAVSGYPLANQITQQ